MNSYYQNMPNLKRINRFIHTCQGSLTKFLISIASITKGLVADGFHCSYLAIGAKYRVGEHADCHIKTAGGQYYRLAFKSSDQALFQIHFRHEPVDTIIIQGSSLYYFPADSWMHVAQTSDIDNHQYFVDRSAAVLSQEIDESSCRSYIKCYLSSKSYIGAPNMAGEHSQKNSRSITGFGAHSYILDGGSCYKTHTKSNAYPSIGSFASANNTVTQNVIKSFHEKGYYLARSTGEIAIAPEFANIMNSLVMPQLITGEHPEPHATCDYREILQRMWCYFRFRRPNFVKNTEGSGRHTCYADLNTSCFDYVNSAESTQDLAKMYKMYPDLIFDSVYKDTCSNLISLKLLKAA